MRQCMFANASRYWCFLVSVRIGYSNSHISVNAYRGCSFACIGLPVCSIPVSIEYDAFDVSSGIIGICTTACEYLTRFPNHVSAAPTELPYI